MIFSGINLIHIDLNFKNAVVFIYSEFVLSIECHELCLNLFYHLLLLGVRFSAGKL